MLVKDDPNTTEEYERLWGNDDFWRRYMRNKRHFCASIGAWVAQKLEVNGDIIDVGCGAGGILQALVGNGVSAGRLAGLDYSAEAIGRARVAVPGADLRVEDLFSHSFEPGAFGLVICTETLEHIAEYERALGVLRSLAAPGGHILLTVPLDDLIPDPRHINQWGPASFGNLLKRWGLQRIAPFQERYIIALLEKTNMNIPQVVIRQYTTARKPFLSIITRHHLRGNDRVRMMDVNRTSVKGLKDNDCEHIILVDDGARGIAFGNRMLHNRREHVAGDWVWLLDDDEAASAPDLIGHVKAVIEKEEPDIVMVKHDRSFHVKGLIMPTKAIWGKDPFTPIKGRIQSGCAIVRRAVFLDHIKAFGGDWGGDFRYFKSIAGNEEPYKIAWLDLVASKTQRVSGGA